MNLYLNQEHQNNVISLSGAEGDKRIKPPEISLIFIVVVRFWRVDLCGLEERRQTKDLMSKTMAVHVRYKSLYISLPSSAPQRGGMTKFWVFWRTWATTANSSYFLPGSFAGVTSLVWVGFQTARLGEQFYIRAKFKDEI